VIHRKGEVMAGEMNWAPRQERVAVFYISLSAPHDPNGNPRRVFVVFDDTGSVMDAIDEGYTGRRGFEGKYPGLLGGARFATTYQEYRGLLKWAEEQA